MIISPKGYFQIAVKIEEALQSPIYLGGTAEMPGVMRFLCADGHVDVMLTVDPDWVAGPAWHLVATRASIDDALRGVSNLQQETAAPDEATADVL